MHNANVPINFNKIISKACVLPAVEVAQELNVSRHAGPEMKGDFYTLHTLSGQDRKELKLGALYVNEAFHLLLSRFRRW